MKIVIAGGGILGLTLAFFLQKQSDLEIVLLEKKDRFGGKIQTIEEDGFCFEETARCFSASSSNVLIELLEDLQLLDQIIVCDKAQTVSYFYSRGKFHSLPGNFFSYSNYFFCKGLSLPVVHELLHSEKRLPDEPMYRLVNAEMKLTHAGSIFDPLMSIFFHKNVRNLTFPSYLRKQERSFKTLYDILNKKMKKDSFLKKGFEKSSLFFLRDGMQSLVNALVEELKVETMKNMEVLKVSQQEKQIRVETKNQTFIADHLFLTLPIYRTFDLLKTFLLKDFEKTERPETSQLVVVNLGYTNPILSMEGFGYLIPSSEGERAVGVVFDSNIFLQNYQKENKTHITVIIKKEESFQETQEIYLEIATQVLKKHLNIQDIPRYHRISYLRGVYPIHTKTSSTFSDQITCLTNPLDEVSINQCIDKAKHAAWHFLQKKKRTHPFFS